MSRPRTPYRPASETHIYRARIKLAVTLSLTLFILGVGVFVVMALRDSLLEGQPIYAWLWVPWLLYVALMLVDAVLVLARKSISLAHPGMVEFLIFPQSPGLVIRLIWGTLLLLCLATFFPNVCMLTIQSWFQSP